MKSLWIAIGGALGSVARFHLGGWVQKASGGSFPLGTLVVNLIGSLLLGFIMHIAVRSSALSEHLQLALTTGVIGGFTTYSTFNFESFHLLQDGAYARALGYIGATVAGCLIAGLLGWHGARLLS